MKVEEFIKLHHPENGSESWISYCEAIITKDGEIYEAVPSHERKLIELMAYTLEVDEENIIHCIKPDSSPAHYIISRMKYVSIWYDFGIAYAGYLDNPRIVDVLEKLEKSGLIAPFSYMNYQMTTEYHLQRYKERHGWYEN